MWVLGMEAGYSSRATSSLTISSPWHCLYNKATPRKDFRYELSDEGGFANPGLESLFSLQNLHCEYRLSSILPADSLGWERNEAQTQYQNSPETERKPIQRKWSEYQDIENKDRSRFAAVNMTMYNIRGWSQRSKGFDLRHLVKQNEISVVQPASLSQPTMTLYLYLSILHIICTLGTLQEPKVGEEAQRICS